MSEQNLTELAQEWANNEYIDQQDREEIQTLIDQNNEKEITERFYKDLEFGTGGLRAIIGIGRNRISKYSVRKATQAFANVINQQSPNKENSIAISFDSRNFSQEFSKEVASVFAANNIKAYIYKELRPVCFLSYAVRELGCIGGVMVTASHNPPEYNGYKAYWSDGAQVTEPIDQLIINEYQNINSFDLIKHLDFEQGLADKKIEWIGEELEEKYYSMLEEYILDRKMCLENGKKLSIVYTPIHGTGLTPCQKILTRNGFNNLHIVSEQAKPDGNFPTVKSPNPENPSAMKLATELMLKEKADLAYGTDPDTDRLGVVVNFQDSSHFLTGNQIGTLMFHYILKKLKNENNLPEKSLMVTTIVTSKLLKKIASDYGVKTELTLTGFKWICRRVKEYEENHPEYKFLFGTEESFGYLSHPHIRDKDGVNSVILMSEVALYHKLNGKNLLQALDEIYTEHGFSHEELLCLDYYGKDGADKIQRIMTDFRLNVKSEFAGEKIIAIEDFQSLIKKSLKKGEEKITSVPTNALGYEFESGDFLYLRPSGTEPKIKFYIMIVIEDGDLESRKIRAKEKANQLLTLIKSKCEKI